MMRTRSNISQLVISLDNMITTKYIPAITGGIAANDEERLLLSLPARYGGLAIPIFRDAYWDKQTQSS